MTRSESPPPKIDDMDEMFIWYIVMGNTSAYSVWLAMKKEAKEDETLRTMAYKNVNKRIMRLATIGLIEEIRPDKYSIHGRRDYKVTNEGMSRLIFHILLNPFEVPKIIQYMDKFGLNKKIIGDLLLVYIHSQMDTVNRFFGSVDLFELYGVNISKDSAKYTKIQKEYEERNNKFVMLMDELGELIALRESDHKKLASSETTHNRQRRPNTKE